MANDLVVVERMTELMAPRVTPMLAPLGMQAAQLRASFLMACEKNPRLMDATALSLQGSYLTAGVLGLMCDGVTGQGFVIPYNIKGSLTAQFQIGYKGYPVIAYRGGFTINQGIVREGDDFDYREGSAGYVNLKRALGRESDRRILGAWATATKPGLAPIVAVLSIDEITAIKNKSKGAQKSDSPWNDPGVGFPAMAAKSATRRMARMLPVLQVQYASALDTMQEERGRVAYLNERGDLIDDGATIYPETTPPPAIDAKIEDRPAPFILVQANGREESFPTVEKYAARIMGFIPKLTREQIAVFREKNGALMASYTGRPDAADAVMAVDAALTKRDKEMQA